MRRIRPGRLFLTLFLLGFAVFFGLDLATSGMERVQGPAGQVGKPAAVAHQPDARAASAAGTARAAGAAGSSAASAGQTGNATKQQTALPAESQAKSRPGETSQSAKSAKSAQAGKSADSGGQTPPKIEVKESFLNHLSNRIGDALHKAAKGLMGLVVSFFDAIIS